MARPHHSQRDHHHAGASLNAHDTEADCIDPRTFGLVKAAYAVNETLDVLSIGRTSLYAVVKRGELKPVKFGKKTLFLAVDLAALLTRLKDNAPKPDVRSWPPRK
jgi:Helix-turn-helix domain